MRASARDVILGRARRLGSARRVRVPTDGLCPVTFRVAMSRLRARGVLAGVRLVQSGRSLFLERSRRPRRLKALTAWEDPVLAELWDNPADAAYDRL